MDGPVIEFTADISTEDMERMFNEGFPNLRIRLVRAQQNGLFHQTRQQHNGHNHDDRILVDGKTTVRDVISLFWDKHHLIATIYRLTGNTWIPVKQTQDWSLAEQNNEGINF